VLDEHARVAAWVAEQAGCSVHAWAGYACIGLEIDGRLTAGVVLESFTGRGANIHVAGMGKYWLNRDLLYSIFHYCFNVLHLKRLTGLVPASNHAALAFDQHIGFRVEATLPDGAADGDLVILCMRPEDCRYLPLVES
jgi:RimJ/RimL family protein N-acetyltransferase